MASRVVGMRLFFAFLRLVFAGLILTLTSLSASAHVKWFAPYNVPQQPRLLSLVVFSAPFIQLLIVSLVILTGVCLLERSRFGAILARSFDRMGAGIRARTEDLYRAGTAAFFIALFTVGDIILTPELLTTHPAIPWIQAGVAAGMFWRATMALSAAGIVALYAFGWISYGAFHMLDYPIFLGLAAYLAMSASHARIYGFRPLDVARWGAAITLMWASIEKWAYPDWTYPLLQTNADLTMGISPAYYMVCAGFVEFGLAFALLWTPLVRALAATVLAAMFVSAVFAFGRIDAIGHLMIIVILVTVGADSAPVVRRTMLAPLCYCGALVATFAAYYGLHAAIYGTAIW
jgi:hypothetical protein